jgi:hypothetical protein
VALVEVLRDSRRTRWRPARPSWGSSLPRRRAARARCTGFSCRPEPGRRTTRSRPWPRTPRRRPARRTPAPATQCSGFFLDRNFRNRAGNRNSRYPPRKSDTAKKNRFCLNLGYRNGSNKMRRNHTTDGWVWCGGFVHCFWRTGCGFDSIWTIFYFLNSFKSSFVKKRWKNCFGAWPKFDPAIS